MLGILALTGSVAAGYLVTQDTFLVYDSNQRTEVSGHFDTVADVLAAAGISVRPQDEVVPALSASAEPSTAIQVSRANAVTLRTASGTRSLWTRQATLGAFLREVGIDVQRTDDVFADGRRVTFPAIGEAPIPAVVEVGEFKNVTIHDGDAQQTIRTAAQTVGAALQEANITLYAADGVEPAQGDWIESGMRIVVRRSMPLTIRVDGRLIQTRSHHTNSLNVLAEAGIGLVGQDYAVPGPAETLSPGDTIEVVRVTEDFRVEDQPIAFETRFQPTDQLELDNRALLQAGVPGILRRRVRVRHENGVVVGEQADAEWVAREPVDEIVGYGTRIEVRALETENGYYEYWRKVRMRVTSYTAASSGKAPDHPTYGITASGLRAGTGIVAVDPRVVPFRSWVYVPGYGTGFAGDTGGGVKGRWIDLGYDQSDYQSWSGYVDVYYLTPVPAPEDINHLIPTVLP